MDDDWDIATRSTAASTAIRAPKKWDDEDDAKAAPASDWDATSSEEEEDGEDDDPRERARRAKQRELQSDLANAQALLGTAPPPSTTTKGQGQGQGQGRSSSSSKELDALLAFEPRNKEDFHRFSSMIIRLVTQRLQGKASYPAFVEYHACQLAKPLSHVDVRKAANALSALASTKHKGVQKLTVMKQKTKAANMPNLGSNKANQKLDMTVYDEEAMDDEYFGTHEEDENVNFM